jgi:hypothetical protein
MRFHLFMLLIVILVSLGMHGMATAATSHVAGGASQPAAAGHALLTAPRRT